MENTNNKFSEDISNCPYHNQQNTGDKKNSNSADKDASNGDWENERDTEQIDEGYNTDRNDNSGGSGSSGSASTNS